MSTSRHSWLKAIVYVGIYAGLLMPLVFIPVVIFPFVFSKLIAYQALIGLTFPAYLVLAWINPAYRPRWNLLYVAVSAYFVALILSVLFAIDPLRAWWGNQERMNGLFTLLHFFAWLTMAVGMLKTWPQWRRLLNYQVLLAVIMAIVAMLQKKYPNILLFPASTRIGGLLDNPIYMAAYQIFTLFFIALLFLKTASKRWRIAYALAAIAAIIAFVMAQSRGGLLGLGAGIIVFSVCFAFVVKERKIRYLILGGMVAVFAIYGLLFAFRQTTFVRSIPEIGRLLDFSGSDTTRFIAWKIAWDGFRERPLFGWGLDNFHILFNQKYNPESMRFGAYETWFDRSHNTVLDALAMTGALGLLTYLSIFGMLFFVTWRAYRREKIDGVTASILTALPIAYFVQNLFVFDHPAAFSMSFLLFGFVIGMTYLEPLEIEKEKMPDETSRIRSMPWLGFVVLQVAFALLVWRTSILPFHVSRLSIKANQLFTSAEGYDLALQASKIWTPYLDEQTFLLSRNLVTYASANALDRVSKWHELYALAKQLTDEELIRHPKNTHPHFIYSRLLHEMGAYVPGEAPAAERQYLEGIESSPKRQQLHYGLARLYLQVGKIDDAIQIYKNVRDFDLELGEGYWTYGLSLMYDKHDLVEGPKQIIQSQTVRFPYSFRDQRELVPMMEAYIAAKDHDGANAFASRLGSVIAGSGELYAHLAFLCQQAQYGDCRDTVLAFGKTIDPAVQEKFEAEMKTIVTTSTPPAPVKTKKTK